MHVVHWHIGDVLPRGLTLSLSCAIYEELSTQGTKGHQGVLCHFADTRSAALHNVSPYSLPLAHVVFPSPIIHLNVTAKLCFQVVFGAFESGTDWWVEVGAVPQAAGDPPRGFFALFLLGSVVEWGGNPVVEDIHRSFVHPGFIRSEVDENRLPDT